MFWNERSSAGGGTRKYRPACRPDVRLVVAVGWPNGPSRFAPPVRDPRRRNDVLPLGKAGLLAWLSTAISEVWTCLLREYCISRVTAALRVLDDRSLRDVGIDRDRIDYAVRHRCDWR